MLAMEVSTSPPWGVRVGFITSPNPSNTTERGGEEGERGVSVSILQLEHPITQPQDSLALLLEIAMTTNRCLHDNRGEKGALVSELES